MNATRERSRAYPGITLQNSVENLKKIKKSLGSAEIDRTQIAHVLGVAEGTVARPTAALVHFGMLERAAGNYRISELGRLIADPLNKQELEGLLKQSIRMPSLYSEVLDHYANEGQIPDRLATVLARNFGIAGNASELAASVFIESAKYANIVDENLKFIAAEASERQLPQSESPLPASTSQSPESKPKESADGENQTFHFKLSSNKFARLSVPSELTTRDIEIIKKQIELLELQIRDH